MLEMEPRASLVLNKLSTAELLFRQGLIKLPRLALKFTLQPKHA